MSIYHPDGKRVLMCGDRNWTNREVIAATLHAIHDVVLLIEGGASGADYLSGVAADERGIAHAIFNANWDKYGKAAGALRNEWMLYFGRPQLVVAFHNDIKASRGTISMLRLARAASVSTRLITEKGDVVWY